MTHFRFHTALGLALGASLLSLATAAQAQQSAEDIIVTAQRENRTEVSRGGSVGILGDKAAQDVPFSIKSYNAALILNQQPNTLGQVLENDPSIRTTYGFGNASEQFVIRGFELFSDDIGLDGLYGITPRQLIAPELYSSVQVLNGANAFLNGAAPGGTALGGGVNLIPKRAGNDALTRATVNYTSREHFGGSADVSRRFGANGEWGLRINGAARRGDVAIDGEFRSAYVIGGALDYESGPLRVVLDLAYQKVRVERLRPKVSFSGAVPRVPDADINYGQPWTFTDIRDVFGQLNAQYDLSDNAMLYAAFGARDGAEEGFYGNFTLTDPVTGDGTTGGSLIPYEANNEAAQAGIRVKLGSGAITHEINFGGSIIWQESRTAYEFYAARSGANLYNPVTLAQPDVITFASGDLDDPDITTKNRLWSVFASDTIGLWEDRILVIGGMRLQYIKIDAPFTQYEGSAVTPVVGVVFKPIPFVSLFANRIEALTSGETAPLEANDPESGLSLPVSNARAVLPPFKSKQYEIGLKLAFGGFNASLAAFQTDKATAVLTLDGNRPGFLRFGPNGTQRNRGLELSVDGELAEGLRVIAGGSVIDAKNRDTGNEIVGVPDVLANANVEWDLPFAPGVTLTGRVTYTGEQWADIANTAKLPSWTRFDAGARFVTAVGDKPLTLRFNVDNIANKRYWASAYSVFAPDLLQGAPRTFKASASIDF